MVEACQTGAVEDERFTAVERLVVRYAEAMHQHPGEVPSELIGAIRSAISDAEFVELAYCVAQFIGMGQLIHLLGVPNPDVIAE